MNKTIYELLEGLKILQKYDPDATVTTVQLGWIQVKIKPICILHKNDLSQLAKYRWCCYENFYTLQL